MNFPFRASHVAGDGAADQARARLISEFRATIDETENLLRSVGDASGERVQQARARLRDRLRDARSALGEGESALRERYAQATHATEQYVADHPWRAMTAALAAGVVIGLLLESRR